MTPQPWLPISTAPQDGSWILLYDPASHNKVYTGMWDASFSYSLKDERNVGAWTSCIAKTFSFGGLLKLHPTHWMPLPQAP